MARSSGTGAAFLPQGGTDAGQTARPIWSPVFGAVAAMGAADTAPNGPAAVTPTSICTASIASGGSTAVSVSAPCSSESAIRRLSVATWAIVDRSGGNQGLDVPYRSLLPMDVPTYQPESCPLCARGVELVKPGSRPGAATARS